MRKVRLAICLIAVSVFGNITLCASASEEAFISFGRYFHRASDLFHDNNFVDARSALDSAMTILPKLSPHELRIASMMFGSLAGSLDKQSPVPSAKNREYIAKSWMDCTAHLPKELIAERITATQLLARIYVEEDECSNAEQILLKLVKNATLEGQHYPIDAAIENLAGVYASNFRPLYAKQCWNYLVVYDKVYQPDHYFYALTKCVDFLLSMHLTSDASRMANELLTLAHEPQNTRKIRSYTWCSMARDFAVSDEKIANKLFEQAYETALNTEDQNKSEYLEAASGWSAMLIAHNRLDSAIAVLQKAFDHAKTLKPESNYRDALMLIQYTKVKISEFDSPSSNKLQSWLGKRRISYEAHKAQEDKAEFEKQQAKNKLILADPSRNPRKAIVLLIKSAEDARVQNNCNFAIKQLNQALSIYENTRSADADSCYDLFKETHKKFENCGKTAEGTEFLWRLVRRKMVQGFKDSEYFDPRYFESGDYPQMERFSHSLFPRNAVEELLQAKSMRIGYTSIEQEPYFIKLLECANESNKSGNVLFALAQLKRFYRNLPSSYESRLDKMTAICEQMEKWREVENQPRKQLLGLLDTASVCVENNKFQKAVAKLKQASLLKQSQKIYLLPNDVDLTNKLQALTDNIGSKDAEDVASKYLSEIGQGLVNYRANTGRTKIQGQDLKAATSGTPIQIQTPKVSDLAISSLANCTVTPVQALVDPQLDLLMDSIQANKAHVKSNGHTK